MPVTGNMQSVKKGIANDRIDTFIWALDQYYRGKSNLLMNYASFENAKVLKKYLNIFENANDYCQVIYHINDSLVDELIASGIRTLDKAENIVNYMNLAIKFWKEKIMFFRKHEKIQSDIQVVHELDILDKILLEVRSYF